MPLYALTMMKMKIILLALFIAAIFQCTVESTSITGTITVESLSPAAGSTLPDLGQTLDFTFTNISWKLSGKEDSESVDIVAWFVEDSSTKVGWTLFSTTDSSGTKTHQANMPSWNSSTFTKKPTTLSIAVCKSKALVSGVLNSCTEVAVTETYSYQ